MKTIPSLLLAGFSCALLSGCYVDRKPTMTLEERMMASDKEIAEYEAAKKAETVPKAREVETPVVPVVVSDVSEADALKAKFPAVGTWREATFSGRKFVFGITGSEISGWVFESQNREWRRLFVVATAHGASGFGFDANTGLVSVAGAPVATGKPVFTYDLGATE